MKLMLTALITGLLFIVDVSKTPVNGQYFEDPTKKFKKFAFDKPLRGSFNISYCLKKLVNCMELVRSDTVCSNGTYMLTVCSRLHHECDDVQKDLDHYRLRLQIEPWHCNSTNWSMLS